jgi:hypothetical protein
MRGPNFYPCNISLDFLFLLFYNSQRSKGGSMKKMTVFFVGLLLVSGVFAAGNEMSFGINRFHSILSIGPPAWNLTFNSAIISCSAQK